jgi:hypothetical protein
MEITDTYFAPVQANCLPQRRGGRRDRPRLAGYAQHPDRQPVAAGPVSSRGRLSSTWHRALSFRRQACRPPEPDPGESLSRRFYLSQPGLWTPLSGALPCHNRQGGRWPWVWTGTAWFARAAVHEMQKSKIARQSVSRSYPHSRSLEGNTFAGSVQRAAAGGPTPHSIWRRLKI